jgi:DNA-binding transcriptional LysR family regulator
VDTRLLRTFVTLARTESFTAAADELHLAQSTVSAQMKSLEGVLHARLFDRLPNGTRLTETGRRLLNEAEDVLDAVSRLRATALEDAGPPTGRVVLAAGESLCSARLPHVVATLRHTHPGIDVELHPLGTAPAVDGVRSGQIDLALLLEENADYADLRLERIGSEQLVLVCAPGHPLADLDHPATWQELARESFFLHEQGCSYSDRLALELSAVPGARPRLTRFGSIEATRSCVAAGLGLTVLPRETVKSMLADGSLRHVIGPVLPDVPVQLARHRRRWESPAARAVRSELLQHIPS